VTIGEGDERALHVAMTDIVNDKTRRLILFLDYDGTLVCLRIESMCFIFGGLTIAKTPPRKKR
jgi:hypothetical protein